MDYKEAKRLKVGDRIEIWAESPDAAIGTITEANETLCRIRWDDDGKHTTIHRRDMRNVTRYHGATPIVPTRDHALMKPMEAPTLPPSNSDDHF